MELYLSGGGDEVQSRTLDQKWAEGIGRERPMLYIPIAMDMARYSLTDCRQWINKALNPLGIEKIEVWDESDLKTATEEKLSEFAGIYIGGGNTYKLLHLFKQFNLTKLFRAVAEDGLPIYGGSAGAIILGCSIATSKDENEIGLCDLTGLDLLNGVSIWCHYDPSQDKAIKALQENRSIPIIWALAEGSGVIVADNELKVVRPDGVEVFDRNEGKMLP